MEVFLSVWTFPVIILAAFLIAWGAECAQFYVSQGLALAILAWLQTLPEFAVEAVIAYEAGQNPDRMHLIMANFTGSLRLFVGLGWPLVFFVGYWGSAKQRGKGLIELGKEHAVTVVWFIPILLYMLFVYFKGTLTMWDGTILILFYFVYLFWLYKMPAQELETIEDLGRVPRFIMSLPSGIKKAWAITGCFILGILILVFYAHPFLESMLGIAVFLGISQFIFVQWIAPILSEFPEKVSALYWAKTNRGGMGLVNFVSSGVNQWTLLIGMCPFIVAFSAKGVVPIVLDDFQKTELLLTMMQGLLGMYFLMNMEFRLYEAAGLFVLWLVQFTIPSLREEIIWVYGAWFLAEAVLQGLKKEKRPSALSHFAVLSRERIFRTGIR